MRIPERVQWAVDLLDVQPDDDILEIGCGPGQAIRLVCDRLRSGSITAIDRSATAVTRARALNAACIVSGHARIEQQTLVGADLGRCFAKVFAINVNAFWTAPTPNLRALATLLTDSGRAYLVYEPPSLAGLRDIESAMPPSLEAHGFDVVDVRTKRFRSRHGLCIIGRPRR